MTARPSVDVVVPFVGSDAELQQVRERFRRLRLLPSDTLVVVDNRAGARRSDPDVIPAPGRQSSYHARNRGAEVGRAEWIVFLDADVEPPPDLLDRYFAEPVGERVSILGGGVEDVIGERRTAVARYAVRSRVLSQDNTMREGFAYPQTANAAYRRSAFERVGGFVDGIRSGGDADLCFRMRASGWALEWRPQARVRHHSRERLRALLRQHVRYGAGTAWLDERYPGFGRPAPWRELAYEALAGVVRTVRASRAHDREGAVQAALWPLVGIALRAGWLFSNECGATGVRTLRIRPRPAQPATHAR